MRIVVAMDSFKGSLSAEGACAAVCAGVRAAAGRDAEVIAVPMSDGGEGFAAVMRGAGAERDGLRVCDAAGVIGLGGRRPSVDDVLRASSASVAALLRSLVLDGGTDRGIIGLGGTRTMDGGLGFACACGLRCVDASGRAIDVEREGVGHALGRVRSVSFEPADWLLHAARHDVCINAASDVRSPLFGPSGAARTFGRQKGADGATVAMLDEGVERFASLLVDAGLAEAGWVELEGAGAAGGLGFALHAFAEAELVSGFEVVRAAVGLDALIDGAALVITGEGRLDGQSSMGKVAMGVASVAALKGVRCVAVVGRCGVGWEGTLKSSGCSDGFDAVLEAGAGLDDGEAMANAAQLLEHAAARAWSG